MLAAMVDRVFLGWNRPFLTRAADWLLERCDELPRWLVVVPTSQGGRRLRETLAERSGALLSPRFVTPGSFLKTADPDVAPDWMERVAWFETLQETDDWQAYQDLFPEAPEAGGDWAGGLASEMVALRHALQENGLTLASAARKLAGTIEAGRWDALGRLETLMERKLRAWGMKSRSRVLAGGLPIPDGISAIVLAGVTEMPPLVEQALLAWNKPVTALIGAPEDEADAFSTIGKPLACWSERTMPWPEGGRGAVRLVADPRQQAAEAWRAVTESQKTSDEVALGTADSELGDEIARVFTSGGWTAFHPAALPLTTGLDRWMKVWSGWLADPKLSVLADLLTLPETGILVGGRRAQKAERLCRLRNDWMVIRPDDLRHRMGTADFRSDTQQEAAEDLLEATAKLERWRADMLRGDFVGTMQRLLELLGSTSVEARNQADAMANWLIEATPLMHQVERGPGFWLDAMLAALPSPPPLPPEDRVIDVQGWLELYLEPGSHLVLCGMNEGKVPARNSGDPWLGEAACKHLGLRVNADRAARDAFLYQTMLESRSGDGRVDLICAKSGAGGEALLPSRLLLAANRDELPQRVKFLFRELEPPEAGLRWHADWRWQPRRVAVPKRLGVTSLATWLACPFRFYLKHGLNMQSPEPGRVEWNARDFGTVAHEVMERWGRDAEARDFSKTEAIHDWLANELDRIVIEWFANKPPLAVRLQAAALRQRLQWLARVQACSRAEGWEIIEVEHKFEIPLGDSLIVAKIDRIDRHRETGALRVIDYKTGKVDGVDKAHRRKVVAATKLPAHLGVDSPALYSGQEKGKPVDFRWLNLQLPLYALAVRNRDGVIPQPCYFTLGNTEAEVAIREWGEFSEADLAAAETCAGWVAGQIANEVFWPPAETVAYDDFAILAAGKSLDEVFAPPFPVPPG
jgi:ATP-dependent helicase/nuclease subunit B